MSDDGCNCGCSTKPEPVTETSDDCTCGCECCGEPESNDAVA